MFNFKLQTREAPRASDEEPRFEVELKVKAILQGI